MIEHLKASFNQKKGQHQALTQDLKNKKSKLKTLNESLLDLEECRLIMQSVTENAQNTLAETLNTIVTDALQTIWGDEYAFKMKIESKSSTVTATPYIMRGEEEYSPKADSGYGIAQVVGLALRVALLSLQKERSNIILFDEPFKDIDKLHMPLACELLHTISEKMRVQMLTVTHEPPIKDVADKLISIQLVKDRSKVEEV